MKRLACLLLVAAPIVGVACSDDDGDAASTETTATTATTTAPTSTSTTVASTTATTAAVGTTTTATTITAPVIPTVPADYAAKLIEAWESGDADAAHVYASDEAFDALFAQEGGGAGTWHLQGCEGAAGSSYCTFSAGGEPTVIVRVLNEPASQANPQAVTEVRFEG